jgi:hypothetical protein
MAIVKANYITRGKTAAKALKQARQAASYYGFRKGPDRAGRIWHAEDRRTLLHADVSVQIAAGATDYPYTYRLVLSTSDVDIGAEGYHQVLAGHFEHYYFVEHHNTNYPHAHVIGFRQRLVRKGELQAIRGKLVEVEQAREQQLQQERDIGLDTHGGRRGERERGGGLDGPGGD